MTPAASTGPTEIKDGFSIEKRAQELEAARAIYRLIRASEDVLAELERAEQLHPNWPTDPIHQVAILAEEVGEAIKEANDMVHKGADVGPALRRELVQCGAMCLRCLKNLEG